MPLDQKKGNITVLVLFLGTLMGALDIAIVGPALPAIQTTFTVDGRLLTWLFTTYVLFNLIGTPLMAKLADQFGRREIYIADVGLFAVGSLLVAEGPSFSFLMAGRALQGFGAGGIFPVASAVIGDTFPPGQRGRALGLIGAVFGLAFILGPILGGLLLLAGWQWLFFINLPLAGLVIGLSLIYLPAGIASRTDSFDWAGMLVLAGLLSALTFAINQINTPHFAASLVSSRTWPFLLATVGLLPTFVIIERRAKNPVIRPDLFSSRQMILAYLMSAGAGFGEASIVFIPALAVAAFGVRASSASFLLMPLVLAMTVGSPMAGRLLDRTGSKKVILSGTFLLAAGMLILSGSSSRMTLFVAAGVLSGIGLSALLGAPVRFILLNEAAPKDRSAAQGLLSLFTGAGQLIAGALIGALVASATPVTAGYQHAYLAAGSMILVLALAASGLKSKTDEIATTRQ